LWRRQGRRQRARQLQAQPQCPGPGQQCRTAVGSPTIPADYRESVTGAEIHAILKRWVETELLYQHALKDGLEREAEIAETLHQMQRQILADEYLQRELKKRVRVSAQEVQDYYDQGTNFTPFSLKG
jgi:hypothetical protein